MNAPSEALEAAVRAWSRYQVKELVGAGGGGFVWRAFDERLDRWVALKFLRVDDAKLAARLLREAQAQARIDHPNVCKVYDVGSLDGRPYIAMQFCEGKTLDQAELPLEARVKVMRDVADAIHAAHRLGLVHRDLKPGNVMVDDAGKAFVVDFGLARELSAPGLTATGVVQGTPAYMAPEQARGDEIDRRADVYGLGATLYHLLTGRPPFAGDNQVDLMMRLLHEEPLAPRKIVPSLPIDLETIALHCLEKEPGRRYPSARAVAEDLTRFLDGEPIEARRRNALERAFRWAKKRRALVALASLALVAVAAGGGYGLWAQAASVRRARVAAEFGQVSAEMQSTMDRAHLLPLHDLRPDARAVEKRLREIESRLGELGAFAEGPGRYALGRGQLALYEYEAAKRELERAWDAGEHRPEVALALGEALGELYQVKREAALRLPEPERGERLAAAQKQFRDPALARLRAATGGGSAYVEGLIALYEERFDDALARATEAAKGDPWFYPAERLEAQAMRWIANAKTQGGDYDGARAELEKAGAILDHALTIGRSDPQLLEAACARYLEEMREERRRNGSLQPLLDGVRARCGEARTADPDRAAGWAHEAAALDVFADWQNYHGLDAVPTVVREIELAEKALALEPGNLSALEARAGAWENRADWEAKHGVDPLPSFSKSLENYQRMTKLDPNNSDAIAGVGRIYGKLALLDTAAGRDAGPNLQRAAESYRVVVERWPDAFVGWDNLGVADYARGADLFARGLDPTAAFQAALHDFAQSGALNPRSNVAAVDASAVHEQLAELAIARGGDPEPELLEAERSANKALEVYPDMSLAHEDVGEALMLRASWQLDEGRDASAALDAAKQAFVRSVKSDPACLLCWVEVGRCEILAARIAMKENRSPAAAFAEAQRQIDKALALDRNFGQAWLAAAWLHRWRAEWKAANRASEARAGLEAVGRALEANPNDAESHFAGGALHLVAGDKDKARQELERAQTIDRWFERRMRPLMEQAR